MAEFGTGKTIFILAIVVGCFAILWPKVFYPMLVSSLAPQPKAAILPDASSDELCCNVIFETDVNAIKVLTEMCGDILHRYHASDPALANALMQEGKLPKVVVDTCRDEVLNACGFDITAVIKDNVRLTKNYKLILDEIRSYNNSACLKKNFGVQFSMIGTPRRMGVFHERTARHLRPERPAHLHPDMLHPALREKGRAIPQRSQSVAAVTGLDGPRPIIPGMRPPMGGAGHVVPAPKGSGTMGIVMPLYTVGIVIFFVYTIMKVLFKKTTEDRSKSDDFGFDPELRRMMFGAAAMEQCATAAQQAALQEEALTPAPATKRRVSPEPATGNGYHPSAPAADSRGASNGSSKLVVTAISGLIAQVDQQREQMLAGAKDKLDLIKEDEGKDGVIEDMDEKPKGEAVIEDDVKLTANNVEEEKVEISSLVAEKTEVFTIPVEESVEIFGKPEEEEKVAEVSSKVEVEPVETISKPIVEKDIIPPLETPSEDTKKAETEVPRTPSPLVDDKTPTLSNGHANDVKDETPAKTAATAPHPQPPSPAAIRRPIPRVFPAEVEELGAAAQGARDTGRSKEAVNGEDQRFEQSNNLQEETTATNYTTASAAALDEAGDVHGQEETSADISGLDDEHAEAADIEEPAAEVEDLPQDDVAPRPHHGQSNGLL